MFCFHNIFGGNNSTEPGKSTCGSIIVQIFFWKLKALTLSNQEKLYRDYNVSLYQHRMESNEKKDVIKSALLI